MGLKDVFFLCCFIEQGTISTSIPPEFSLKNLFLITYFDDLTDGQESVSSVPLTLYRDLYT